MRNGREAPAFDATEPDSSAEAAAQSCRLAESLAADLDGSFEGLVLAYQDRLYAFSLRLCGSRQDAEEVSQDTFVRAYRALAGYPPERILALRLRPWLYQIALNLARNRARRFRPELVSIDDVGGLNLSGGASEQPEILLLRAERRRELAALVASLPWRYRAAVVLRHVQELPYGEIAGLLGQPVGTVKANVHRGVRLLRERMEEQASDQQPAVSGQQMARHTPFSGGR